MEAMHSVSDPTLRAAISLVKNLTNQAVLVDISESKWMTRFYDSLFFQSRMQKERKNKFWVLDLTQPTTKALLWVNGQLTNEDAKAKSFAKRPGASYDSGCTKLPHVSK